MRLFCFWLSILALAACNTGQRPVQQWQQAPGGADAAAISSDHKLSVVSSVSNGIVVWDMRKNLALYRWQHHDEGANLFSHIRVAADNSYVVTADREAFALWNLQTGEPEGFWRIDESSIRDIAVSNNGRGIIVGRGNGKVMFFEPGSGRRLEFLGHQEKINSLDISPNGFYALSGGNDYVAYLWDTRSAQVIHKFDHPSRVTKVVLDEKGRYAFTADSQKAARIWDVQTGTMISNLSYLQRQKIFSAARFSDDGKYLLTGSPGRQLILWDVATGKKVNEWRVTPRDNPGLQGAVVHAVSFFDNNRVLSISSSGLAETWNIE